MERYPLHGGNLGWAAERYGLRPRDFIDFSSNVNPLGPSPHALDAARSALDHVSSYPEPHAAGLKKDLSAYLKVDPSLVMLGNGSTELIHHVVACLAPRRVCVLSPAFAEYERAARAARSEVVFFQLYPEEGFDLDTGGLIRAAVGSDITFAGNPASPTGRLYPREELLPVLEACREQGTMLVVDESFMGFCPTWEAQRATLIDEAGRGGLVIISTLTKLFALAGLRGPGWLVASADLVSRLEGKAVPWRVNAVAIAAAQASLMDREYLQHTREAVEAWRKEFANRLAEMNIFQVLPSHTNFLLLKAVDPALDIGHLADTLGRRGLLVRVCSNFRGLESGYLRVAVRTPPENERFITALKEVIADISLARNSNSIDIT